MIALYIFIPLYCPSCGTPTRLDRADNALSGKYQAYQALSCPICGVMYKLATSVLRFFNQIDGVLLIGEQLLFLDFLGKMIGKFVKH